LDDGFPHRFIPFLSAERREKIFSYRFPPDRKLSVVVYLLLRLALMEKHGINEPVVFAYGKNGKPFLRDHPHIHFNLSHCRSAAACVISDTETGVDVQEIAPVSDGLARRVLSAEEYAAYKASHHPDELFCQMWTAKESYLKRTGQGIGTDLTALPSENTGTLFKGKDYYCCVSAPFNGEVSAPFRRVSVRDFNIFKECDCEPVLSGAI
jgi:4'-phosphopantetheinyl transferase